MPQFKNEEYKNFEDVIDVIHNTNGIFGEKIKSLKFRNDLLSDAKKYSKKNPDFLERLWANPNGAITIKQGDAYFSKAECKALKNKLHNLTIKIKSDHSHENYLACISEMKSLKKSGDIRKVYLASIARAFLTFHPQKFINRGTKIKDLLNIFRYFEDANSLLNGFDQKNDWYTISTKLRSVVNDINNKKLNSDQLRWAIDYLYEENKGVIKLSGKNQAYNNKSDDRLFDYESTEAEEGYNQDKNMLTKKRDKELVKKRKAHDNYTCKSCFRRYEIDGKFVIDCHHLKPISLGKRKTQIDDLISLCPTCHRIAHLKKPPYDLSELREIVGKIATQD